MTNGNAGKFGDRLKEWIFVTFGITSLVEWGEKSLYPWLNSTSEVFFDWLNYLSAHPTPVGQWARVFGDLYAGRDPGTVSQSAQNEYADLLENPSEWFGNQLAGLVSGAATEEGLQLLGSIIYDTSVGAITGQAPPAGSEAADRARQFVGYVTALGALPGILDTIVEVASVGQIDQIGRNIQQIYWNLGLGFLTWQVMAPILEASILQPLERDVQRQWRGQRFTRAQYQDLYALGKLSLEGLKEELRVEGWRDADIDLVVELSFRQLTASQLFDAHERGLISTNDLQRGLRGLGYAPEDVTLLIQLHEPEGTSEDRKESISVLTQAYRELLLPEELFRQALSDQGYSEREVDLRVALTDLKRDNDRRNLTLAQLKRAWAENVVGDAEVRHWLSGEGWNDAEAALVLETWKAETEPGFLKVNQSTILEMYRYAIFTRGEALERLQAVGYARDTADQLLDLEEARHPDAFGAAAAVSARVLSMGAITDLYALGRIGDAQVLDWARRAGFSQSDAEHLLLLISERAGEPERPLGQRTIEDAYLTGVFSRDQALTELEGVGFDPEDAEVILQVVERNNPAVFAPETVEAVRQPSISALVQAVIYGLIDEVEFYARALKLGYPRDVAEIYLTLSRVKPTKSTKSLTKTDILSVYEDGLLSYSAAQDKLIAIGYSLQDSDLLLRLRVGGVQGTDLWAALLGGYLEPLDAFTALLGLGFSEEEINAAVAGLPGGE